MYTGTMVTEVIHQHNLMKQLLRRAVDHTSDGTQENGEGFVTKDDHNGGSR